MKAFLALFAVVAVAAGQRNNVDPKQAAILAEARYLSGDGSFGAAYVQEDGVEFKEETDQNGDRKGQYSYVDPNGMKITVHYTAGKNGFQVSGDHLPKAPAPLPIPAAHQPRAPAVPQYNPAPQYNAISQAAPRPSYNGADDDGQYRPEIHEAPYQYREGQQYQQVQAQPQPLPQPQYTPQPQPAPATFNYQHQQPQANYNFQTTPPPSRFFPPGKLDLQRTPDGFNFQFQSRQ